MDRILVPEFDDFPVLDEATLERFDRLQQECKTMRVTFYCIPSMMTPERWEALGRRPWIEPAFHGIAHVKGEMDDRVNHPDFIFDMLFERAHRQHINLFKAPWYGIGARAINVMCQYNIALSIRHGYDVFRLYPSLQSIPPVQVFCAADYPARDRLWAHPDAAPNFFRRRVYNQWREAILDEVVNVDVASQHIRPLLYKLNLGCGGQVRPGWESLDAHPCDGRVKPWKWNEPLPYPDNSVSIITIQHTLMYVDYADYGSNLKECLRVLAPRGEILIQEDNNLKRIWKPDGTEHWTGTVRSNTNREVMEKYLTDAGFTISPASCGELLQGYGDLLNRHSKIGKDLVYAVKAFKPACIPVY